MQRVVVVDKGALDQRSLIAIFREIEQFLNNKVTINPKADISVWIRFKVAIAGSQRAINEAISQLKMRNLIFN